MGRRDRTDEPKWGRRTPPKSERAAAAADLEADERRRAAGLSRSAEALRAPAPRMLGEKSRFLAVDLGLATGIAVYGRDGRLESVRAALRDLIDLVKRESSVVRQAAERLSAHMAGILQSVHSALAHANLYSRGGRIAVGANVMSSLDIKS
jgi:hypothetical protein